MGPEYGPSGLFRDSSGYIQGIQYVYEDPRVKGPY